MYRVHDYRSCNSVDLPSFNTYKIGGDHDAILYWTRAINGKLELNFSFLVPQKFGLLPTQESLLSLESL